MALIDSIISAESGGNPNARNPNSSAGGLGQFIDSTWLAMLKQERPDLVEGRSPQELLALKSDPALSRQMTEAYAAQNGKILTGAGFEANPGNSYLAHFAGPQGAVKVLGAAPSTPVSAVLGDAAVKANPFLRNMTTGDLQAWAARKMGGEVAAAQPAPSPATPQSGQPSLFAQMPATQGLQRAWDNATPGGPLWMAKTAIQGMQGAVQGSKDAVSVPQTEEEAFRQNQGREQGPIGAADVMSIMAPGSPRGAGGIFARAFGHPLPRIPKGASVAGTGPHGPIVNGLEGRFPEAVDWLRKAKTGDARGVLSHPELGDRRVDLIHGTPTYGVRHIDKEHPGDLDKLPQSWEKLRLTKEGRTRTFLDNEDYRAVVPKNFEGTQKDWLLTFYKRDENGRPDGKLIDSATAGGTGQGRAELFPDQTTSQNVGRNGQNLNPLLGLAMGAARLARQPSSEQAEGRFFGMLPSQGVAGSPPIFATPRASPSIDYLRAALQAPGSRGFFFDRR